jgi:lycopene cyclase domain-containing protein
VTYWALNAVFLVPAAVVLVLAMVRRGRRTDQGRREQVPEPAVSGRKGLAAALGITAVVLLVLTAVFDNVMIAAGLFWYNPERISGAFIGSAPLEDFAYALAAVLLLPALWLLLEKRDKTAAGPKSANAESPAAPPPAAQHEEKQ